MNNQNSPRCDLPQVRIRSINRARSWLWFQNSSLHEISVWKLEYLKAAITWAEKSFTILPKPSEGNLSKSAWHTWHNKGAFLLSMAIALVLSIAYILCTLAKFNTAKLPEGKCSLVALHGEWSTRTSHLLESLQHTTKPIKAVILLGRLRLSPKEIIKIFSRKETLDLPLVIPLSWRASLEALADLPHLITQGLYETSKCETLYIPYRERISIAFRVIQGAVAARWWLAQSNLEKPSVIFGITGTADTTLLERAIQKHGGRSIHAVHGQVTGPNFIGTSDLAIFRSDYDANFYSKLHCYKSCKIQSSSTAPRSKRGKEGILFLSNLAHPMNSGFQRFGLNDELKLLAKFYDLARLLGQSEKPIWWKPHPIISTLSEKNIKHIRSTARKYGFKELHSTTAITEIAEQCHWIISSPSTIALDLLQAGFLSVIYDLQRTILDSALIEFPQVPEKPNELADLFAHLGTPSTYEKTFHTTYNNIKPAEKINILKLKV